MTEPEPTFAQKIGLIAWLLLALVALAIFAIIYGRSLVLGPAYDVQAIEQCRAELRRARSRADTTRVDLLSPINNRVQAARPINCGELRMLGKLK